MSTASKRVPRIDAAAKRTRQKTADEIIVAAAPAKTTKRAKSTEKTRKASVSRANKSAAASRSPSRSPSRQRGRKSTTNKSTLGAKVHTKKELEAARSKRGASRSRRSPSATRTKSKSAERKSADRSRNKDLDEATVADLQQRYGSDNVKRNTYFEDDDLSSSRYSLRKRTTPTPSSSPSKASASSINIARRGAANAKCWFTCGYLKYKNCDVCKIVAATVVLLIALAVINYFHLVDLATIRGSVTNCASTVYNTVVVKPLSFGYATSKAACEGVRSFLSSAWARVAS